MYHLSLGLFLASSALGQQVTLNSSEFADLQPDQATTILDTANDLQQVNEYLDSSIKSGRSDLVKVFFEHRHTSYLVPPKISALPDSPLKDSMVIMMLRSESLVAWDADGSREPWIGSTAPRMYVVVEPFRSMIKKYLPLRSPDDTSVLYPRKSRLALAADLEAAALKAGVVLPATAKTATTSSMPGAPAATPQAPVTAKAPPATPALPTNNAPPASRAWLMWGAVIAAVASGLF